MKAYQLFILFLVLCLCGCSFGEALPKETDPITTSTATTTIQTEPPTTSETTAQPDVPTTEAGVPTTETTAPPQVIVQPEPIDEDFVKVIAYIPDLFVDLRYSTENNFTNQKIYGFTDVWLRYGTVKKLMLVQDELKQSNLYLKI